MHSGHAEQAAFPDTRQACTPLRATRVRAPPTRAVRGSPLPGQGSHPTQTRWTLAQLHNLDLEDAYDRTIEGWAKALDLRDEDTAGHSQRVTDLTLQLAQRLGLPEKELQHIRRGALLHDIGKMALPDSILLKPGKLSDEEFAVIKQHPIHAYNLLKDVPYLRPALAIPHHHHERWDGTGYPDRLSGENIPFPARIFAVVDVYDALTSDRPYRPAWTHAAAIEHIRTQAGTHFDPRIVTAFLDLLERSDGRPTAEDP